MQIDCWVPTVWLLLQSKTIEAQ
uniref:Uncharacterized protein n=1 Tax=Anguilla anguilla TaxID=7936 RepID=A0A0E9R5H1_ANGAN